jgi:hypothetical protein
MDEVVARLPFPLVGLDHQLALIAWAGDKDI